MFTQCPTCRTVYEISAKDLAIAQGRVRCGFCETTFNALESLTEDPPAHGTTLTGITVPSSITQDPDGNSVADAQAEPVLAVSPAPSASEAASFAALAAAFVEAAPVEEAAAAAADSDADAIDEGATRIGTLASTRADADPLAAAWALAASNTDPALAEELEALIRPRSSAWVRAGWSLAASVMLTMLGAQLVHHWRGELVLQPTVAPALHRVYAALGIALDPHWDVKRYAIVQHPEMSAERDGNLAELRLTATIANDAVRPQPYPMLRLILEDRWGTAIAARDFAPREYLHGALNDAALLAPGEQAHADLLVVDPGADTVGFTLDICLVDANSTVHCANDAS